MTLFTFFNFYMFYIFMLLVFNLKSKFFQILNNVKKMRLAKFLGTGFILYRYKETKYFILYGATFQNKIITRIVHIYDISWTVHSIYRTFNREDTQQTGYYIDRTFHIFDISWKVHSIDRTFNRQKIQQIDIKQKKYLIYKTFYR